MTKKRKLTGIEMLRKRERRRRLVPPVVFNRRHAMMRRRNEDPAVAILSQVKRYSNRHVKTLSDLIMRSMGLVGSPEAVKEQFTKNGLDDIQPDAQAIALINNAVRKISEILIFRMVADELVNDKDLREKLVELFTHQRFDAMVPVREPKRDNEQDKDEVDRIYRTQREALTGLLHNLMDT